MPARASRSASWSDSKFSLVLNTALWLRTSSGPPPSADVVPPQDDGRISRAVTCVPAGASFASFAASAPLATSTAPSGGIGTEPVDASPAWPCRSVFGAAAGNGWSTTAVAFGERGRRRAPRRA